MKTKLVFESAQEKEFWERIAHDVAVTDNCGDKAVAVSWADYITLARRERLKK